jgi:20S proteasome alpha/beta subunit
MAQQYYLVYEEPIPTAQLVQRVAMVMQEYTQSGYECETDYLNCKFVCLCVCEI